MKATPRPWKISDEYSTFGSIAIEANTAGMILVETEVNNKNAEANAELIVRAVNCHDELVSFLESINGRMKDNVMDEYLTDLLKRARGEN